MDKTELESELINIDNALSVISGLAGELSTTSSLDEINEVNALIGITKHYTRSISKKDFK